tara:strand:+ start:45788 stop:46723 length:936 start_codon:yes stop_codon:yes gene_type:complete
MKNSIFCLLLIASFISCKQESPKKTTTTNIEAITLLGDTIYTKLTTSESALDKYNLAKADYLLDTQSADAIIWYGRRTAYTGQYQKAITIFTEGIEKHPEDARMYRHRGHRYITTRQYDKAIADFEKAVTLIKDKEDIVEPDGLPNAKNIPLSTLHGNIWYHLGLTYYLKNDMPNALRAYSNRTVTEKYPDNAVSGGYWLYMIQRRLGNAEEANASIATIIKDMDIIENMSYHTMCLLYKGLLTESDIASDAIGTSSSDVLSYGLGNWTLYEKQDAAKAKEHYKRLLADGSKFSFAYLAAESDWKRLFLED